MVNVAKYTHRWILCVGRDAAMLDYRSVLAPGEITYKTAGEVRKSRTQKCRLGRGHVSSQEGIFYY